MLKNFRLLKMVKSPTIKLNNGLSMPALALGTYNSINGNECEVATKYAIDAGYRHIDTAYVYNTEKEVGKAVRDKIAEGVIKREDIFVVTKLWLTFAEENRVVDACKKSLNNLGLDYIDLYLIHAPVSFEYQADDVLFPRDENGKTKTIEVDYVDTWRAMEKCVNLGLTKSIGVSNFNSEQITRLLSVAKIKPVNNQVECSPSVNQKKLIQFCKENDIVVTAYCPLGRPDFEKKTPDFMFDEKINNIGKKYNKTGSQIVLRYLFELGTVPLPKSVTKSRIEQNIDIFDFQLNEEDRAYLDTFNKNKRICLFEEWSNHKYYPFNIEF